MCWIISINNKLWEGVSCSNRGIYTVIQTRQKMPNRSLAAMLPRATTHYRQKCQFQNIPNRSVIFWRVLACFGVFGKYKRCYIAMLGDVTSGAELDVVLKENDRTIYTKNNIREGDRRKKQTIT